MKDFIDKLQHKSIHVVGVSGAEGSSILRFLVKHKISRITAHDFSTKDNLEASFNLWHKSVIPSVRYKLYQQFQSDLKSVSLKLDKKYLESVEKADMIFVPQSWRLYKKENEPLLRISDAIPLYSLTRLYLDFAPAKIIAVTGTVGKGSTSNIIYQLLKRELPAGRNVYFAGNETWMVQLADKLDEMTKKDFLVLEISHRQLQDGFTRAPGIVIITNLYPNHLDEVSMQTYIDLKLSLVKRQNNLDFSVLNYDTDQLRLADKLKSKVIYYSGIHPDMNTKSIQKKHSQIMNTKSDQYPMNILAGISVCVTVGLSVSEMIKSLPNIKSLPARMQLLHAGHDFKIYDDIKSTTPWATLAGLNKLGKNTILICGGRTKGIEYYDFTKKVKQFTKLIIVVKSELGENLKKLFSPGFYIEAESLAQALQTAFSRVQKRDNILISPAAGFFYSDFIKGKGSIRQLIKEFDMNYYSKTDSKSNGIPE